MFTQLDKTQLLEISPKESIFTKHSKFKEVSQPINMLALKLQTLKPTIGLFQVQETLVTLTPTQPTAHVTVDASHSRTLLLSNNGGKIKTTNCGDKVTRFTMLSLTLKIESITKLTRLLETF